jgi:hypothetical protein
MYVYEYYISKSSINEQNMKNPSKSISIEKSLEKTSITINYTTTTMNSSSVAGKSPLHLDVREVHQRLGLGFV